MAYASVDATMPCTQLLQHQIRKQRHSQSEWHSPPKLRRIGLASDNLDRMRHSLSQDVCK